MANNVLMRAPAGGSQVLLRDGSVLQIQASGLIVADSTLPSYPDLIALGCVPLDPLSSQSLTQASVNPTCAAMPF